MNGFLDRGCADTFEQAVAELIAAAVRRHPGIAPRHAPLPSRPSRPHAAPEDLPAPQRSSRHRAPHFADFTVRRGEDGWYVHSFRDEAVRPYPKARAIAAAMKTGKIAQQAGRAARVREELRPFRWKNALACHTIDTGSSMTPRALLP